MSHGKFKYESRLASEDVAGYLESLASGIRQRQVRLESGSDSVSLRVADEVSFECSASEDPEKSHAGFTLSIEWRTASSREGTRRSTGLHVTSGSAVDEEAVYAEPRPVAAAVRSSAPSNAVELRDDAVGKPSAHRSPPRAKASHPQATRTKAAARRPAADRAKASVGSRAHARRRAAS